MAEKNFSGLNKSQADLTNLFYLKGNIKLNETYYDGLNIKASLFIHYINYLILISFINYWKDTSWDISTFLLLLGKAVSHL